MNKLKQLAEKYIFSDFTITSEQYNNLKKSKYSRIFDVKPYQVNSMLTENYNKPKTKLNMVPGIEKYLILDLIEIVEDEFKLDLSTSFFGKYKNVDLDKLKTTIKDFRNITIMSGNTKQFIDKMLAKQSTHEILFNLYSVN